MQPRREPWTELSNPLWKAIAQTEQTNTSSKEEAQLQTVQTSTIEQQQSKCRRTEEMAVYLNSVN